MEPNKNRVTGHFMRNVITRALPAALTDIVLIVGILLFYVAFKLDVGALSSICTAVMGMVGLLMVHETSKPYNKIRTAMMIFVCVGFVFSFLFLEDVFHHLGPGVVGCVDPDRLPGPGRSSHAADARPDRPPRQAPTARGTGAEKENAEGRVTKKNAPCSGCTWCALRERNLHGNFEFFGCFE